VPGTKFVLCTPVLDIQDVAVLSGISISLKRLVLRFLLIVTFSCSKRKPFYSSTPTSGWCPLRCIIPISYHYRLIPLYMVWLACKVHKGKFVPRPRRSDRHQICLYIFNHSKNPLLVLGSCLKRKYYVILPPFFCHFLFLAFVAGKKSWQHKTKI
jgi:hypothetical protein